MPKYASFGTVQVSSVALRRMAGAVVSPNMHIISLRSGKEVPVIVTCVLPVFKLLCHG